MKKLLFIVPIGIALLSFMPQGDKKVSLVKKWETDTIMKVPESVLYNPADKLIYVANIYGSPDGKDGNGFISRLTLDGTLENLKWAVGLDAPKGMAIHNNKLYVTDINNIAVINITTGKVESRIYVEGSKFLNDISFDKTGNGYISDSGDKKIYILKKGVVSVWLEGSPLVKPNGVLAAEKGLRIIDMGSGIFYEASYTDKKLTEVAQGVPVGDGVMSVNADEYIISCWPGEVYYIKGSSVEKILDTKEQKKNSADAWYIVSEKLLIVPTFYGNTVAAYTVQ